MHPLLDGGGRRGDGACGSAPRSRTRSSSADRAKRRDPGIHIAPPGEAPPRWRRRGGSRPVLRGGWSRLRMLETDDAAPGGGLATAGIRRPPPGSRRGEGRSDTPSTAWMRPARRPNNPRRTSNLVTRSHTSSTGPPRTVSCGFGGGPSGTSERQRQALSREAAERRNRGQEGACRGAPARRRHAPRLPSSTLPPWRITRTRSAISATTPMSCVMKISPMPSSRWKARQQPEHLRLHGHVERGRRLIGNQEARPAGRAPWRSSPAGACRRKAGTDSA